MKRNVLALVLGSTIAGLAGVAISNAPASAENFVVDGNKALNTNNGFSKVDGQPRMSIWDFNPTDPDQQFDRSPGGRGGTLLKQRSTGKCLNAHYLTNGGPVNVWPCNASDPDQNFNITSVGNGYSQIQRTGTNLCVDSPTRNNLGTVHLWQCVGNVNQRWRSSGSGIITPPSSYYSDLGTLSSDKWDEYSGDNTRFDPNRAWDGNVDERGKTPASISQVYTDLSATIFGQRRPMNTGYLYDNGYFNAYGTWHAGIDIGAGQGSSVKTVIGGTTWLIQSTSGNYFMAVKGDDGKLWIYGHLGTLNIATERRIEAGQVIGTIGSLNHLHLEVQNNSSRYEQTLGAHKNQQFVRDVSLSPLQAFWQVKNR